MRFHNVHIESSAYFLPDTILSSADIEKRLSSRFQELGFAEGRLAGLTGIKERRVWPVGTRPSTMAAEAGKIALARAGADPKEVELVIHCGVCRDSVEPATAGLVHCHLDLDPSCGFFDISNACVGFLNGLIVAANMIELGQIRCALVVSGENAGPIYEDTIQALLENPSDENMRKSLASLTLGSGAVAFVLRHKEVARTTHQLIGGVSLSDSPSHHVCSGNGNIYHQSMETDTQELLKRGLVLSVSAWDLFKRKLDWTNDTPDHVFTHQVSKVYSAKALETLRLGHKKNYQDCEWLGNTGSVAVPLNLAMRWEEDAIKANDHLALLGIGSGLACVMLGVTW